MRATHRRQGASTGRPLLIDATLAKAAGEAVSNTVGKLIIAFPARLHLSTIHSEDDLPTLATHLRRFAAFYDEEAQLLALRLADCRRLIDLPHLLTPQQWGDLTSLMATGMSVRVALAPERLGSARCIDGVWRKSTDHEGTCFARARLAIVIGASRVAEDCRHQCLICGCRHHKESTCTNNSFAGAHPSCCSLYSPLVLKDSAASRHNLKWRLPR